MSFGIGIEVRGTEELQRKLEGAAPEFRRNRRQTMRRILLELDAEIQKRLRGRPLKRRTGNLARLTTEIRDAGKRIEGRIGPQVPYGRIHEEGGIVRPKTAQWLTIPLDAAKTAAGVTRGRAREFRGAFFIRSRRGNLILARRRGKQLEPLFVLKKSVTIKKRPYLAPSAKKKRSRMIQLLGDAFLAGVK